MYIKDIKLNIDVYVNIIELFIILLISVFATSCFSKLKDNQNILGSWVQTL